MHRIGLVVCALPLIACGDGPGSTDIEGTLLFSDRNDTEISRLVNAASGSEGFQAQSVAESFADPFEPGDPCPARAFADDTGTITGGCTTLDGVMLEGTITIQNPFSWCLEFDEAAGWCDTEYDGDYRSASVYTFDNFTITQSGFARSFDGVLSSATTAGVIDMDITSTQLEITVRSDIHAERAGTRSVNISGSGVELVGVGGAVVAGQINVTESNESSGSFTLAGADTLQVALEGNCVSWNIEGTNRMYSTCPQ
jgi:hypothetical protein